ncbi:unnamed protein product [Brassica napus]|uniref:(rape) hypothetical protein n=1 Tax=Brassica napus TaxID=3708 RepID=A0A816NXB3_BRANA|nr:unnamed protein product [Brassica napus]
MAPSDLLGWLCLRHAMASTAPFMAGFSYNFHRSSPIFLFRCVPVECSIRHPTVISEPVKSTASLLLSHLVLLCFRQGTWLCAVPRRCILHHLGFYGWAVCCAPLL